MLDVSMLGECMSNGNAGVGDRGGLFTVCAGYEYVVGTRDSCIVSGAADILGMSVVHGMRGAGGACELCMCLARGVREVSG